MVFRIMHSDCKEALRELIAEGVQVDSIVTDPPYELGFMGKHWDKSGIANDVELWQLCLEVLKPGGHLLSFGGSRTYHRMATAIEDAGFEIRDQIMWIYGQGFPKSLDVSKALDKMEGAERTNKVWHDTFRDGRSRSQRKYNGSGNERKGVTNYKDLPTTDLAKQWAGWGSALKPAHEPIVMARKPLSEKNIASNVIKHGTGGINIDGCRVGIPLGDNKFDDPVRYGGVRAASIYGSSEREGGQVYEMPSQLGRFPANLIHDGSDEVEAEFARYGDRVSGSHKAGQPRNAQSRSSYIMPDITTYSDQGSSGSASRFFYSAKASKSERNGSKHPTVKPIALMRYLCRLITPPNGTILDPFAGTGTTGQAALEEGFGAILIEREAEYIADIKKRIDGVQLPLNILEEVMEAIAA